MNFMKVVGFLVLLVLLVGCQKKQEAEQPVTTPEPADAPSLIDVSPFSYLCLPHTGSYQDHEAVIAAFMQAASDQGFEMSSPLLGIYYNSPADTPADALVWEVGFSVPDSMEVLEPLVVKKWTFTRVARVMHTGLLDAVDQTYSIIFKFIDEQNLMPAGPTMERFLNDPQQVPPDQLKTEIWVPVSKK